MIQIKRRFFVTFVVLMCCVFLNLSSQTHAKGNFLDPPETWTSENIKVLLHSGDVNATANNGTTPLQWAAEEGHTDIVRILLNAGADVKATNYYGGTPLGVAASKGHTDIVQILLEAGAEVNAKNEFGTTPLH